MGQVLHGSARTTQAIRRAIQQSQESLQSLATRYSINPKIVAKWRKRSTTADARMGPEPVSTVLSPEQERLPLSEDGQRPPKKIFKDYPMGYLHVDFAEVRTEEGRQYLFVAIDRTSKGAFAELHPQATRLVAADFLRRVGGKLPYKVHTVLTDNGVQFTLQPHQWFPGGHRFARVCQAFGVEHCLTRPAHPWTNGPVEGMHRTIQEATVQRYHYQTTDELNEHLQAFLLAYNHAKRLKTLRGLTPHEVVCAQWQKNPTIVARDPSHLTLGLYT